MTTALFVAMLAATGGGLGCYVRHLHRRLHLDELTCLGNRLALSRLVRRARRQRWRHKLVGLVMLDLDQFKQINDTYGHAAGNQILVALAHRIRSVLGRHEYGIRLHGDEFAIWLPRITADTAQIRLHAITSAINAPVAIGDTWIDVTASAGMVIAPATTSLGALLTEADQRMYAAKHRRHKALDDPTVSCQVAA